MWAASEALVGGEDLVDPGTEHGDTGVDGRNAGGAGAASPGDDANQNPGTCLLTHQRATRIPLREHKATKNTMKNIPISPRRGQTAQESRDRRSSPYRRWLQLLQHRS